MKNIILENTAGHSGYATINQVNRLVSDIIYLNPEHVVFFDGINDFLHSHNTMNWEINDTLHQNKYRNYFYNPVKVINFKEFFYHFHLDFIQSLYLKK